MIGSRPKAQKKKRNRKMLEMWRASQLSYKDIGSRFGVTGERARQIIKKELTLEKLERIQKEDPEKYREMTKYW